VDFRLEVVVVPVSDVDRAKAFYGEQVGFATDHDAWVSDDVRVVQLTPPGSACSIAIGSGFSKMEPGSVQGLQLVVDDIDAARAQLVSAGVEVSPIRELGRAGRPGFRFVFFSDPDGNGWAVQELPSPRPSHHPEEPA
jgi:catechol 2,3-dioxygenase-like lactoylglutathione lyase family enzyme